MKPAFLALLLVSAPAFGETPDPSQVEIRRITYSGPGCVDGSVAANVAPDAQAFTLIFDSFLAEVGPTTPGGRAKTSCRVTIDLRFPQGWSYSLFDVDYRGYRSLDSGVQATHRSKYYYQATPNDARTFQTTFRGPVDDNYFIGQTLPLTDLVWSQCGRVRAMNLDTEIEVSNALNPQGSGMITVDSIDGAITHIYGIKWLRCP